MNCLDAWFDQPARRMPTQFLYASAVPCGTCYHALRNRRHNSLDPEESRSCVRKTMQAWLLPVPSSAAFRGTSLSTGIHGLGNAAMFPAQYLQSQLFFSFFSPEYSWTLHDTFRYSQSLLLSTLGLNLYFFLTRVPVAAIPWSPCVGQVHGADCSLLPATKPLHLN